ncbi:MAG: tetratricopeptide repeat protein [Acidobacteriota bacterium]
MVASGFIQDNLSKIICLTLFIVVILLYGQAYGREFVNYDDYLYIVDNPHIQQGLAWREIKWVFTHTYIYLWIPLTWISFMFDYQFFGLNASAYHLHNAILHGLTSILLFLILKRLAYSLYQQETNQALWVSAFMAALFALHPLRVESVAWATERKDVLSGLFWMLALLAHLRYVRSASLLRYLVIVLCLLLGLMAKPMVVTLPCVLLLLDYWPLGRFQLSFNKQPGQFRALGWAILEKIPLLIITLGMSIITTQWYRQGGLMVSFQAIPLKTRIANAIISYVSYLGKMIWPTRLAVIYPYSIDGLANWEIITAALLLSLLTLLALWWLRRYPWFAVGWFWYLGTLVPVIGITQAGLQAMADRFSYLPQIGIHIILLVILLKLLTVWPYRKWVLACSALLIICGCLLFSKLQLEHWQNTYTLFGNAADVVPGNYIAYTCLGDAFIKQGNLGQAIEQFHTALRIAPNFPPAHSSLGNALMMQGNTVEARLHYTRALELDPNFATTYNNLATLLTKEGKVTEAIDYYQKALQLDPNFAEAYFNLGTAYAKLARYQEAILVFQRAIAIKANFLNAHYNLGLAYLLSGDQVHALEQYKILKLYNQDWANTLLRRIETDVSVPPQSPHGGA